MPRVVHFEFIAEDPERAVAFYERVFGWKVTKWEGPFDYWLVSTGPEDEPGIDGAIVPADDQRQAGMTYTTIDVPSVDECLDRILREGGKVIAPKTAIPGEGYVAFGTDTEGTIFGIMELDETAS